MAILPKKFVPLAVGGVVAIALAVGGGAWWINKQRYEATDNAFVQADTTEVSPQIEGYVVEVLVADNQRHQAAGPGAAGRLATARDARPGGGQRGCAGRAVRGVDEQGSLNWR